VVKLISTHFELPDKFDRERRLGNGIRRTRKIRTNVESKRLSGCISKTNGGISMKANSTSPEGFESTYALLMRSEEKHRSRFETLIYTILIVSTIFAVLQFGRQAVVMPSNIAHLSNPAPAAAQHGA
jgi:hypothetical protein